MAVFGWLLLIWIVGVFPPVGIAIVLLMLLWEAIMGIVNK